MRHTLIFGVSGAGKSYLATHLCATFPFHRKLSVDDIIHDKLVQYGAISPFAHEKQNSKVLAVGAYINDFSSFDDFAKKQFLYHSLEEHATDVMLDTVLLSKSKKYVLDTTG